MPESGCAPCSGDVSLLNAPEDGAAGRNLLAGVPLPAKCRVELQPGQVVTIETPGGGGYGSAAPAS